LIPSLRHSSAMLSSPRKVSGRYRLAALGTFAMVEQGAVSPLALSSSSRDRQAAYARLSHKAITLRLASHSDAAVVEETERLLPHNPHAIRRSDQSQAMYFIGRCLLNNNNPRATRYLLSAILNPRLVVGELSLVRQCLSRNAAPHDRRREV